MTLHNCNQPDAMPIVRDPRDFDPRSGNMLEHLIFNHRPWIILLCMLTTVVLGFQAAKLTVNASFEKMIPQSHPYIRNYLDNRKDLSGMGNTVRVVVENTRGDIFDPAYLATLARINDELFLLPGTERAWIKSLWTPVVRWTSITEEGFQGGPVMPENHDGSPQSIEQLRINIDRAGIVGSLVANDLKSSMIIVPLMEQTAEGKPLDYGAYARSLEQVRTKYESPDIKIHIVGFAKLAGDLIEGLTQVMLFFGIAAAIAVAIIMLHTRCWRSTLLLVGSALLGVLWLLGLMHLLGFVLDPYSILMPFLIFSIGLSHGAQKINGIMQDIGRGTHRYVAARYTFRRLFLVGLTALLTNMAGFAVLTTIDIPAIRELALITSLGVGILIFTKLMLVPVMLSYVGVNPEAAKRSLREEQDMQRGKGIGAVWHRLERLTERRWASGALLGAGAIGLSAFMLSLKLQVGDLDPGAPELRPEARYNRDNAFITANYGLSSDQFAVMVKTPAGACDTYATLLESDRLGWALRQTPGVQDVVSLPELVRRYTAGGFEGSPKWLTLPRNQILINQAAPSVRLGNLELSSQGCEVTPVIAYLSDHKADTLKRVLGTAEQFAAGHDTKDIRFLPAAGSAGIEAVTNIVVSKASTTMPAVLYGAVALLCFITFRSWRAVLVALVPLVLTSFLCEALMVLLGIGVKVATLPVIALGVGIGIDYALYLLSVQLAHQRAGVPLRLAYRHAIQFTGRVVALVGLTLGAGVVTWAWSPIKFQRDMGILLTVMFLVNMTCALVLIPALSHYFLVSDRERHSL